MTAKPTKLLGGRLLIALQKTDWVEFSFNKKQIVNTVYLTSLTI
ncbi:hypothetical protein ACVWYG_000029 [Pedobacter sp. UYEF25]